MKPARIGFVAVVVAQLAFLLAWAGYHERVRSSAPTMWLQVLPVDPRDPLRGDFAILNFEASNVPPPEGWAENASGRLWVRFAPGDDGLHRAVASTYERPGDLGPGEFAAMAWPWGRAWNDESLVRVRYEIEKFFVPEGKGELPPGDTRAEVAITPRGALQLKRVWVDGRPWP